MKPISCILCVILIACLMIAVGLSTNTIEFEHDEPPDPITGGVRLITKWCYPITGKHQDGEYKLTKPDTENMLKLFKDVMTDLGYWKDDAQVASETTEKFYAEIPGIWVFIEELPINGY